MSVRIAAVSSIRVDAAGAAQLRWLLRNDPSPRLRAAVVDHLDDDDSFTARLMIIEALHDSDPAVLHEALNVVESWDDPTMAVKLIPLRDHWDRSIREHIESMQILD